MAKDQFPVLEYDAAAEFWVPTIETLQAMMSDNEYVTKIAPDERSFIDGDSMKMLIGVDYIVVENGNLVENHGRQF